MMNLLWACACAVTQPAAAPEVPTPPVVLLLGNNHSMRTTQADLRYADDDALKYRDLFRLVTPEDHIHTLAVPDAETRELYGDAAQVDGAPTRVAWLQHAHTLGQLVRSQRAAGQETDFYLVFAGHGDVEGGQGQLDLLDGPAGRAQVEEVLRAVGAKRSHVILDSCNSFFVLNPRRPGGRIWTTPKDVTGTLSPGAGDVGIFLSTSAEAQVFEWSQLQSGIFSHALRSGLAGAADANGDHQVTYAELEAFVATASSGVQNSAFRPHLYVKEPNSSPVFLDLRAAQGHQVTLRDLTGRVTLRQGAGVRLLDVHPEMGFDPTLRIPPQPTWAVAELQEHGAALQYREAQLFEGGELSPLAFANVSTTASRGSDTLFAQLFTVPFGPHAMQSYAREQQAAPAPVYGLSDAELARVEGQLDLMAATRRDQRYLSMFTLALIPAAGLLAAVVLPTVAYAFLGVQGGPCSPGMICLVHFKEDPNAQTGVMAPWVRTVPASARQAATAVALSSAAVAAPLLFLAVAAGTGATVVNVLRLLSTSAEEGLVHGPGKAATLPQRRAWAMAMVKGMEQQAHAATLKKVVNAGLVLASFALLGSALALGGTALLASALLGMPLIPALLFGGTCVVLAPTVLLVGLGIAGAMAWLADPSETNAHLLRLAAQPER